MHLLLLALVETGKEYSKKFQFDSEFIFIFLLFRRLLWSFPYFLQIAELCSGLLKNYLHLSWILKKISVDKQTFFGRGDSSTASLFMKYFI